MQFGRAVLLPLLPLLLFPLIAGCKPSEAPRLPDTDDFGDPVVVRSTPRRVVSLNPATTDLIFALGAGSKLVGRTHWDLYPDSARFVPDLGSGLRPNVEAVLGVTPDLVVLYASNDNRSAASQLRAAGVNTLSIKIDRIEDFHRATRVLGLLLGAEAKSAAVSDSVARTLERVRAATRNLPKRRVFWHIWNAPLITIARGSYMNELLALAGGQNVYDDLPDASPRVSIEDVLRRNPEYIMTGPQGAVRIRQDRRWAIAPAVKQGRILVVDTTLVGRPSVRLGEAAVSLATLLHPGSLR